jgi:lysophospholipid acyltransferase (LPLAT)-like uncharacterized protein
VSRNNSFKNFIKVYLAPVFAAFLIKLIHLTIRWEKDDLNSLHLDGPAIFVFWHGRQLMLAPLYADRKQPFPFAMLISTHADGQLISKAVSWFGINAVYGSSSQGGPEAFQSMISMLDDGACVGITPDGPRGPKYVAKKGAIKLASITGKKIIPLTYSVEKFWRIKSWDEMIVPKPFSRGVCMIGEPLTVKADLDDESAIKMSETLSTHLSNVMNKADSYFG